ncbi:uncharacterized protein LOC126191123 [Schistocerca cancellata]|uniref:uncharacterized protein LOC126191123 n=1 Tax=Schistocerca cancellata TaxID=274614 RepID=UPI002119A8EA|nr:uncharacterized protein LOC126191123 [Schistocerca cancellata]
MLPAITDSEVTCALGGRMPGSLLAAAALDDDLSDLRDLFWPLNDSWLLDGFDDFHHDHFENAGDFFPEAQSTAAPAARPPPGPPDPEFDSNLVTNVTAQLGGTAFLHCRVRNLGEHTVSWVRRRDWHILTSGLFTYTNDERFQVAHSTDEDWSLQIKYVQKRDNGTYECQVATGAGTMSHYFNLHVVAPAAFILGSGEYHIGEGSTISLVCIIENSPTPPQYVFWLHNERVVNYDGSRAVAVSTEPGPRTHSRLLIPRATRRDSGNYTCSAPDTQPDTINVYVSQGATTDDCITVDLCESPERRREEDFRWAPAAAPYIEHGHQRTGAPTTGSTTADTGHHTRDAADGRSRLDRGGCQCFHRERDRPGPTRRIRNPNSRSGSKATETASTEEKEEASTDFC